MTLKLSSNLKTESHFEWEHLSSVPEVKTDGGSGEGVGTPMGASAGIGEHVTWTVTWKVWESQQQ